jgi:hypothetical protein
MIGEIVLVEGRQMEFCGGETGTHARRLSSVLKGTRLQEASYDRGLQECNQRYYGQVKLHVGRRRFRKFHYIGRYAPPKADD